MKARDDKTDEAKLRQREESAGRARSARSLESVESPSPEATRQLLHALRTHQIELEAQNEELRRTQVELDVARAQYFDLYDLAPVGYITLSEPGLILHTLGWPLDPRTYGGSFVYHLDQDRLAIGYVVGLDYPDPLFQPYEAFQQFKHHPHIKPLLEGGSIMSAGARARPKSRTHTPPS